MRQYAKQNAAYTAQIDADGVLRDLDTGRKSVLYLTLIAITL